MKQSSSLYMKASPEQIGEYVIFSGDPFRVDLLKDLLDKPEHIAFAREFNTYTGFYQGQKITVTSTGIGGPSAAIAMEEMYSSGMKVAIRMGTMMGLEDHLLGNFVIPAGSMREEKTSQTYVPASYPAIADLGLVQAMNQAVLQHNGKYFNGLTCTMDGFYSQMRTSPLAEKLHLNIEETFVTLKRYGIIGIDMESSVILTLGRLMGIKACIVTMTTVLENLKEVLAGQKRSQAEALLCQVVLDGILLHKNKEESYV